MLPISKNRNCIANCKYFVKLVGNKNHTDATCLKGTDDIEKNINFLACKRRCGLIHDNDIGIRGKRSGQFSKLHFCNRQRSDRCVTVKINIEVRKQFFRCFLLFSFTNISGVGKLFLLPQPDVGGNS